MCAMPTSSRITLASDCCDCYLPGTIPVAARVHHMSLESLSAEEHQMVLDAGQRYGLYYVNAYKTTILLSVVSG
jgi:hypothetical protein